jgi:hypothetical protein
MQHLYPTLDEDFLRSSKLTKSAPVNAHPHACPPLLLGNVAFSLFVLKKDVDYGRTAGTHLSQIPKF